jgi:hypothetical protein
LYNEVQLDTTTKATTQEGCLQLTRLQASCPKLQQQRLERLAGTGLGQSSSALPPRDMSREVHGL